MRGFWLAVGLMALAACKQSSDASDGNGGTNELAASGSTELSAGNLAKADQDKCLAAWKAVAIQGCVAIAGSQMSDDESLLPDYRKALASTKGRCPMPPRIEWIAEQAARETIKSVDSYGGAGQQPPTVPELCATSVTYRGKSAGYDMRVWGAGAKGREQPVAASTPLSVPASVNMPAPLSNKRPFSGSKAEIGKFVDEALWGKLGSWECSIWENRQFEQAPQIARMRIEPDGPSTHMEVFIYGRGQPFVSRIYRGSGDYQGGGQAFPHLKIDMQGAEVGRDGDNAYFIADFAHDIAVYGENSSRHISPGSGMMQCVSSERLRSK